MESSTIAFLWRSASLSGAQKRMFGIVDGLNARGQRAIVLLEAKDAFALRSVHGNQFPSLVIYQTPWWLRMWVRGRYRFPGVWRLSPMSWIYTSLARFHMKKVLQKHGVGFAHVAMSEELARHITVPSLFEVTSPDWADRICTDPTMIPTSTVLHAVSPSVYRRLESNLHLHRIIAAPVLFPNIPPPVIREPYRNTKEKLIVFAHRLIPRKNGVLFAKVAKRFLAVHPEWTIAIRGRGPDEKEISSILSSEIADGKCLLGFVEKLSHDLRRSRIFVSIIEPDNYPSQSIVEAMTYGNALLLSDTGDTCDRFFDRNGRVTAIDEDDVLKQLKAMVSVPNELERMGKRSRQIAIERFSQDAYLDHLANVYSECGFKPDSRK